MLGGSMKKKGLSIILLLLPSILSAMEDDEPFLPPISVKESAIDMSKKFSLEDEIDRGIGRLNDSILYASGLLAELHNKLREFGWKSRSLHGEDALKHLDNWSLILKDGRLSAFKMGRDIDEEIEQVNRLRERESGTSCNRVIKNVEREGSLYNSLIHSTFTHIMCANIQVQFLNQWLGNLKIRVMQGECVTHQISNWEREINQRMDVLTDLNRRYNILLLRITKLGEITRARSHSCHF